MQHAETDTTPRKRGLLLEPRFDDLVAQHFGVNRDMSPDPRVRAAKTKTSWLELVRTMEPEDFCATRLLACRFEAMLTVQGGRKRWQEANTGFEQADVYYTPSSAEKELREAFRTRRTDSPLREAVVAQTLEMRKWIGEIRDLPECRLAREIVGVTAAEVAEAGTDLAAMSDWDLASEWTRTLVAAGWFALCRELPPELGGESPEPAAMAP
jgi:hypothetical protein